MGSTAGVVIITGASSGIGLETALLFHRKGWRVVATMRDPQGRKTALHEEHDITLIHLDVRDPESIAAVLKATRDLHGRIDVLVNNAGYAIHGPFEGSTREQIARQYETNVFGLMETTRQVLPIFRAQASGVLVNVASMGGRIGFPLYSLYNSTKWAVDGFSEALAYELEPLGIRVKIVEPGVIRTDFYTRSLDKADGDTPEVYRPIAERALRIQDQRAARAGAPPSIVATCIYRAATDGKKRLRYLVGADARLASIVRRWAPERLFRRIIARETLG